MGVLFTGGLMALGAGVANAADNAAGTDGSQSVLGGTQAVAPLTLPVSIGGNAVSILGDAGSSGSTGAASSGGSAATTGSGTSGSEGVGSGTQVVAPIAVPVTVGGNAVSVLGDAGSSGSASVPAATSGTTSGAGTSGTESVLGGTQVVAPIAVPVTVGGNAVSVLGDAGSSGSASVPAATSGTTSGASTSDSDGVGSGTQVLAPIAVPVNVGGNAVSILGDAGSSGAAGAPSGAGAGSARSGTSGTESVLGGSQVLAPVAVPLTVGGNAVSLLGDAGSSGSGGAPAATSGTNSGSGTSGSEGVGSGTQVVAPIAVPVTVGGNAVSVLGDAGSSGSAGAPAATSGTTSGAGTSGTESVLGGSQVVAPVAVPVTVDGNAVSVLGDAGSSGSAGAPATTSGTTSAPGTSGTGSVLGGSLIRTLITIPVTLSGNGVSILGDSTVGTSPGTDNGTAPDPTVGRVGAVEIVADGSLASGITPAAIGVRALATTGVRPWTALALGLSLLLLGAGALAVRVLHRS